MEKFMAKIKTSAAKAKTEELIETMKEYGFKGGLVASTGTVVLKGKAKPGIGNAIVNIFPRAAVAVEKLNEELWGIYLNAYERMVVNEQSMIDASTKNPFVMLGERVEVLEAQSGKGKRQDNELINEAYAVMNKIMSGFLG